MKNKKIAIIAIVVLLFGIINVSYAENVSDLQTKKNEITESLSKANEELENLKLELTDNLEAISRLNLQIEEGEEKLEETNEELEILKEEIKTIEAKLKKIEKSYNKQKDIGTKRLVALYEMGNTTYLDVLLNSKNIKDFISNYYLIGEIAEFDKDLLDTIEREKRQISEISEELDVKQQNLKSIQSSQEKTLIALENARTIKNSYANSLTEEEKQLQEKISGYQNELSALDSQILYLTIGNTNLEYIGGEFLWPAPGYTTITSPFGTRVHPILHTVKTHTGLDIGAPYGANAVAANAGIVTSSSYLGAYGNCVIIDHGGGICTLYAHGSELIANVGDRVERGQVVMKVGSTGMSTGPHLHFGVTVNGKYVDPLPYLRGTN